MELPKYEALLNGEIGVYTYVYENIGGLHFLNP